MFRKITVTENNYRKILNKIQRITNRKMFNMHQAFENDLKHEIKQCRLFSIGFHNEGHYDEKKDDYIIKKKLHKNSIYVRAFEHCTKENRNIYLNSDDEKMYLNDRPRTLIHMNTGSCTAIIINADDKVMFLPFGIFIVYAYEYYSKEKPIKIYKETFIPDYFSRKSKI